MKNLGNFILRAAVSAAFLFMSGHAAAQYYSWGTDPARLRWQTIGTDSLSIIYPTESEAAARRTMHWIETVKPYISYGYTHGPLKVPIVFHPENEETNGIVMYMPKRIEMLTTPATGGFSMPWMKQLVAHEYRHAAQYSNLNQGFIRILSYIAGQQGSALGLLFVPLWMLEGDAVMSETQMSTFGRGVQPRFTIDYRAQGNIARQGRNMEKWFCGSYRDNIPDHYHLGYQIVSYAYTKYGENIWNNVMRYGVRNPYVFATTAVPLKKLYGTSVKKLAAETFDDLAAWWDAQPQEEDTSTPIYVSRPACFTTYEYPMAVDDNTLLMLKTDLATPTRFVFADTRTGREQPAAFTGPVSTRPALFPMRREVWWSEYRRSMLFAEEVNSVLCYMSLDDLKPHTVNMEGIGQNALYPTPSERGLAWVEYDPDGTFSIVLHDGSRHSLPQFTEIHGLAYDNATRKYYFIATDDDGMHIGSLDVDGNFGRVTEPAYITLSDLRAADGVLYFGSIASGKDEAHCYDLAEGRQYRLTTSRYGSFSPAPIGRDALAMTTFSREGYIASTQAAAQQRIPVEYSPKPDDRLVPPRIKWDVVNLDTVRFTAADSLASHKKHAARRYSKGGHLFNIHSWMPLSFNPFEVSGEGLPTFNLGATAVSQNLLSDSEAALSYGWSRKEGSYIMGTWKYYGLGVHLSLDAYYGGEQRVYGVSMYNHDTKTFERPDYDLNAAGRNWSVAAAATLPLYFQRGYRTRYLGITASYSYNNGLVARTDRMDATTDIDSFKAAGYKKGVHTMQFSAVFQDMARLAHRDFLPRRGMMFAAGYLLNPENRDFKDLVWLYGRGYIKGFAPQNVITVEASYQTAIGGFRHEKIFSGLSSISTRLLPKGYTAADIVNDNYIAAALHYALPLWCPDGGIPSVIYFKRIRLNVGLEYATFNAPVYHVAQQKIIKDRRHIYSYGGDLTFDINLLRMPAAATTAVTVSLYMPRDGKRPFVSAGLGLPF